MYDHVIKLTGLTKILRGKTLQLSDGTKHPQGNFDFTCKIEETLNTALLHLFINATEDLRKLCLVIVVRDLDCKIIKDKQR